MKGYIYKITSPSGKIYIGQTINLKSRIKKHKRPKRAHNEKIVNSIRKYGWDQHDFQIIEELVSVDIKKLLNEREMYWIDFYDSYKNGLNCTKGGEGTIGHSHTTETKQKLSKSLMGKTLSDEAKSKLSKISKGNQCNKGRKISDETKEKLRIIFKGKKRSEETRKKISIANTGKKCSEETRKKISDKLSGKKISENTKMANMKKILCLENKKEYNSITEACLELNISRTVLSKLLNGHSKMDHIKGYRFIYL